MVRGTDMGLMGQLVVLVQLQCDQIIRLFFNIWPFAAMIISPIMSQIGQIRLSIFQIKN